MTRPLGRERIAFALLFVAAIALALVKITPTDTPVHMATARIAFETGHWPTTNTFSYTHPDFPLYQQYPIYQALLLAAFRLGGWEGLSVLGALLWTLVFAMWVRWGARWREAPLLGLVFVVALLGLQRRMILRPDVVTLLLLGCLVHLVDAYRRGRTWAAAGFVAVQWLMANCHQLFPLGLAVQGGFLAHLVLVRALRGRLGVSREDAAVPIGPVVAALIASVLACLATPLGLGILRSPLHTIDSLLRHREHVTEFQPVTSDGLATGLVVVAGGLALLAFFRRRRDWSPFEAGLLLIGACLVAAAHRGTAYFVVIAIGIHARASVARLGGEPDPNADAVFSARSLRAITCIVLCLFLLHLRWVAPSRVLGGTQPGIGKSLGVFPDPAIAFLKAHPPPGRVLNLGWYAGNMLIWDLYPAQRVFVDPNFEAYPREFLLASIRAIDDDAQLDRLIDEWEPGWIVAEVRLPGARERAARLLREGGWALVHADTVWMILVRVSPASAEYIAKHRLDAASIAPADLLEDDPELLVLQLERLAELFDDLALPQAARATRRRAGALGTP